MTKSARTADIAAIHVIAKQLGIEDDAYRDMLWMIARVRSAKDLDFAGRKRVLEYLGSLGGNAQRYSNEWSFIDNAAKDRQPLLRKICAVCRAMKVKRAYAEGVARRSLMLGDDTAVRLELLDAGKLWIVASALSRTKRWGGPVAEENELAARRVAAEKAAAK